MNTDVGRISTALFQATRGQQIFSIWTVSKPIWKRLATCLLFVVCCAVPGLSQSHQVEWEIEPGVVIAQYKQGVYLGKVAYPSVLRVQSVESAFPFLHTISDERAQLASIQELGRVYRVRYDADITPHHAARIIEANPGVVYAEPQNRHSMSSVPFPTKGARNHPPLLPNDPMFSDGGYMQLMGMTKAWEVVKGQDADVVIAIVDNGTDWEHPDLRANLWENPGEIADNGIDDDGNGFVDDLHGWRFTDGTNNTKPIGGYDHGTGVAGAAVAVADNGEGLAGTSWNAKFMPINVACKPPNTSLVCFTGEGVLYAAMNGAQIINASYGFFDYGIPRTDDLTIKAALDLGSLVIASTMNNRMELGGRNPRSYPAAYQETLSVCGTEGQSYRRKWNYGYGVDVCAAGSGVTTTVSNNGYSSWSGTSMAVPLVSGIAALVKTRFPDFTPEQIREQIRATADEEMYQANPPSFEGLLGRGYVNAYRAVTETDKVSIRMVDWEVADHEEGYCSRPSKRINITATFESFLADAENVTIEFVSKSPHVVFPKGNTFSIGSLRSGARTSVDFSITTTPNIPYRSILFIEPRAHISDGEIVSGSDVIELYIDSVELALHETATLRYTMTSEGNIGYTDTWDYWAHWHCEETLGQMEVNGDWLMDEAGLLVGIGPNAIASSVFDEPVCQFWICPQNQDFTPVNSMQFLNNENAEQVSRVTMTNKTNKLSPGLDIIQESFVNAQSRFEDGALFRYTILNQTSTGINGLHVGLFFDLYDTGEYGMVSYQDGNIERSFPYMNLGQAQNSTNGYVGFAVLSEKAPVHYRTYDSREVVSLRQPKDVWEGMTGGIVRPPRPGGGGGEAQLIGSGPYSVDAFSEVVVDFAMIYGENENELVENARRVLQFRNDRLNDVAAISAPTRLTVEEGDSITFEVRLSFPPSGEVNMMVTGYEGTDINPDQQTLKFRVDQWRNAQTVKLSAAEDSDIDNEEVTLKFVASGGGYEFCRAFGGCNHRGQWNRGNYGSSFGDS
ncbi:MAG: S8 family serine peptidase [Rhodothermaceae bacterium]|nr:S8 family serine peptidase [Rhodothermaceae bacterium]MYG70771.1 S8 family serine peptidase [Rhodothermaceae bacterium]MYJ44273.1 S8 family serine peptidase [Rhodothermaceae bacterium]